jgi:MauM/NapG family ferredoxin protein
MNKTILLRRITQSLILLLFLFLFIQTESETNDEIAYPVKLFLEFDPLLFITTWLSSHTVENPFFFSIFVIVMTLFLGRVFCGWICPLGTLNNIFSFLKRKKKQKEYKENWNRIKYYILIFLLVTSILTIQLTGIFDPIALLIRSFSISVFPVIDFSFKAIFNSVYELNPPGLVVVSEWIFDMLKKFILSFQEPVFRQSIFIGLLFLTILGLNLWYKRFWCRFLCPLGALLAVFSKISILNRKINENCSHCDKCIRVCPASAQPETNENYKKTECIFCFNCQDVCPEKAVSFSFKFKPKIASIDFGRRRFIKSVLFGIISAPFFEATIAGMSRDELRDQSGDIEPALIRPPGSLAEKEFLKRCIKCGECMKVCITGGLQPTLLEAGLDGIWSPILVSKIGYCDYDCTLCGQVCPTGAIKELKIDEKKKIKIGIARVDVSSCLPYANGIPCIICEEVCPTEIKAVWLEEKTELKRDGSQIKLKLPKVDPELCIGCGICEYKCPITGNPAIYITNFGESRSEENHLL